MDGRAKLIDRTMHRTFGLYAFGLLGMNIFEEKKIRAEKCVLQAWKCQAVIIKTR